MLLFRYGCNCMFGEMGDVLTMLRIREITKYGFWLNNDSLE